MSDQDARKQSLAELHERRKQVIRLHKRKYGVMQIVELTGLSWPLSASPLIFMKKEGWRR
jgi:hypothetical protein